MVNTNPGFLSTVSTNPNTGIVDGTDNIHSGIINALNIATADNRVIFGFDITQIDDGNFTRYDMRDKVAGSGYAGQILRNGIVHSILSNNGVVAGQNGLTTTVGPRNDSDWYAVIVVQANNTLAIRVGDEGDSTPGVSSLTAGDIPIAIVKYVEDSANDAVDRPVQFLGYNQVTRGISIGQDDGSDGDFDEKLRLHSDGTIKKGADTITVPQATGTLALTSDITYTSAISHGNGGLLPSSGIATTNIVDDAVTYAKIQNVSTTNVVLGRDSAGAGVIEEINAVNLRTILNVADGATADQSNAEIEGGYNAQVAQAGTGELSNGTEPAIRRFSPANIKSMIDTHQSTQDNDDVSIGNLYSRLGSNFGGDFQIGNQANDTASFAGHLTIGGNLLVSGTTTTINTETLALADNQIVLNSNYTGSTPSQDGGIEIERGTLANKTLVWDETNDKWTVGSETFVAGTFVGALTGNVTGNASTATNATTLATNRAFSITGSGITASAVNFNGSGNVVLNAAIDSNAVTTAKILDANVTTAKIADDAITAAKMAENSVGGDALGNRVITTVKIDDSAVTSVKLASSAVTSAKLANDSVTATKIANDAISNAQVSSSAAIAQSKISGLATSLSGKEPSLTISDGLDRTSATLKVDISGLTIENGVDRAADFVMYHDVSNGLRKISPANLFAVLQASDIPNLSSSYLAVGTTLTNANIATNAAISLDKTADGTTNKSFTATLKTKLDAIAASATAGADWASNVTNISVTNAQLAGSIANAKLANSSVTVNGNAVALGGSVTLDTDDFAEGTNKFYTDERVDDRIYGLFVDGEGIDTAYDDTANTLTISGELATTTNKGIASFSNSHFDVTSGVVSVKNASITNGLLASGIAQSKISNLQTNLSAKVENLSDLSITATATELNVLDGIPATVTATEIGYLDGVTSAIQTQLNTKLSVVAISDLTGITGLDTDVSSTSGAHDTLPSARAVKTYVDSKPNLDTTYSIATVDGSNSSRKNIRLNDNLNGQSEIVIEAGTGLTISRNNTSGMLTLQSDAEATDVTKENVSAALATFTGDDTLYIGDTGNDTTVRIRGDFYVDGTTTTVNQTAINVENAIVFEGATADGYETTLTITDPTADRTITMPNITGTLITTGDATTITGGMIASSAITGGKIASNAVSSGKIAANAVTSGKIANDSITNSKIADDQIDSEHYVDGSIDTAHIGDDQVTYSKIQNVSATNKILGRRTANAGIIEEVSPANVRVMINVEDGADVTDVTNVTATGAIMDGDFTSNGFMKRTGAGVYTVDTSTYLTSIAVADLTDITSLDTDLSSVSASHDTLASAKAIKTYVDANSSSGQNTVFYLEDGDGTEVTVAHNKEIKFVEAGNGLIDINWSDITDGTDTDPYDLTFTVDSNLANYSNASSAFLTAHPSVSAASSSDNSGRTYIQDIVLDSFGHITGITTASESVNALTQEQVEDYVAGVVTAGSNITKTYDDNAGTLTIAGTANDDVSIANLKTKLAGSFGSNAVTIGDANDVVTIGNNLIVTGSLTVNGSATTIESTTITVEDPLIKLAKDNNASDSVDIGFYGLYDTSGSQDLYAGLFRDASDGGKFKLFKSLQTEPSNTVNTSGTGYTTATLVAGLEGNASTATALQTARNIAGQSFDGTSNINIGVTDLSDISALDTDISAVSASHNTLASAKAIKTYIDAQVDTEDTIAELNDTLVSNPAAGNLLIYDATSGLWDNAALVAGNNVQITNSDGGISLASTNTLYSAGAGLTLSGTTFTLTDPENLNKMTDDGASSTIAAVGADRIVVWDESASAWLYMELSDLQDEIGGGSNIANSAFKYIEIAGQTTVEADSSADTLTLVGGANVTLTTSADTITLAAIDTGDTTYSAGNLLDLSGTTFNVDLSEASEASIAVVDDYIIFLDGGINGTTKKEKISDFVGLIAGSNLTATNGVLSATNTQLSQEQVEDYVNGLITAGANLTATYDDSGGTLTLAASNTQLSSEQVQDIVGDMVTGNTETNITVTYQDGDGTLDFVSTNTDTTYTAGTGLTLSGTVFTMADPASGTSIDEGDIATNDRMPIWDETASAWRYVTIENLQDEIDTTATGGAGEAFKTISISGQDDVVADTATDTLTFVAGSNITLTANETSDTITIVSADTDTQLTDESVQDIVGAMLTGNTETNIAVTYQDDDGTIDFVSTDTNTIYTAGSGLTLTGTEFSVVTESIQDTIGAMVSGNTETNIAVTYDDPSGKLNFVSTDTNTQLTTEAVQDIVGDMFSSNTETRIAATYEDGDGTIDLIVDDMTTDTNTQLSNEQVQDIVGTMLGGTETRIAVTYDDTNNRIDFIVDDMTANTNTQLSQEQVEDFVGGMLDGTETFITVGYDDTDGNLDFVVPVKDEDDMASNSATFLATQQSIKTYVDAEITGLIDSSPAALNTLNELAAALGDDANYATTTATSLGEKLVKASNLSDLTNAGTARGHLGLGTAAVLSGTGAVADANAGLVTGNVVYDYIVLQDFATSGASNFVVGDITGATAITSGLASTDELVLSDAGALKRMDISVIEDYMQNNLSFTTNTNTQLSTEEVQDIIGDMVEGNTETNIAVTYVDGGVGAGKLNFVATNDNTQLSTEAVQDIVGGMFGSNTETRITATYEDSDGTIDLVVDDLNTDTQLTTEQVQDIVGAMLVGTETRIDVGYDDINGRINFVVDDMSANTQPLTTEAVQDIVGGMLVGTETRIAVDYDDTLGRINFVVDDQSTDANTTYEFSVPASTTTLRLDPSTGTNDDVALVGGTNVQITRDSATQLTFTATDTGDTTYSAGNGLALSSTTFSVADPATLDALTESSDATNDKILLWDENLSIWKHMTLDNLQDAIDTGDTTYSEGTLIDISGTTINVDNTEAVDTVVTVADDYFLFLDGGATGATKKEQIADFIALIAGTNITASNGVLSASDSTLSTEQVEDIVGAMVVGSTQTAITVTYDDTNGKLDFDSTDTTYTAGTGLTLSTTEFSVTANGIGATQLNVSGNGTTSQWLRSDGDGTFSWVAPPNDNTWRPVGVTSGNSLASGESLSFTAGTGITLAESAGAITITNSVSNSNTTYDLLVPASTTAIRLDPSTGDNDDITITGGTGISVARTSATELTLTNTSTHTATNLAVTRSGDAFTITSSTGNDATIPLADTTNWGIMSDEMFDKLEGIEALADVTDAANVKTALGNISSAVSIGDDTDVVVTIPGSLVVTGTTTTNNVQTVSTENGVIFEGTAANDYELTLRAGVVGSDYEVLLPTATGTLALSGASVNYTQLTGTVPTWNQSTTGSAASATTATTTTHVAGGALGSIPYQSASATTALLAGNTTTTKKFLTQTGNGSVSVAPSWGTLAGADIPNSSVNQLNLADLASGLQGASSAWTANSLTQSDDFSISGDITAAAVAYQATGDVELVASIDAGVITEAHLSATNSVGSGQDNYLLSYNHASTNFTWVAPTSAGIAYSDLSIGAEGTASGDGSIAYNNSTGVFTYTPALNITGTAGDATQIAITNHTDTNENNKLAFVHNAAGAGAGGSARGLEIDAVLYYNPSTQTLTSPKFIGDITGTVTGVSSGLQSSASNVDIGITPSGTGKVAIRGTDVTIIHPDTGTPAASSPTVAQSDGIREEKAKKTGVSVANGASTTFNIAPTGSVTSGTSSYRAIVGTIHVDSGNGNFVYTERFMANNKNGASANWDFQSFGAMFNTTNPPVYVELATEGDEVQLKISNSSGATETLGVWYDLTLFPST